MRFKPSSVITPTLLINLTILSHHKFSADSKIAGVPFGMPLIVPPEDLWVGMAQWLSSRASGYSGGFLKNILSLS